MKQHGTVFGGAMLIAGTSIGGGMLALPVQTSLGGFIPSIVLYIATWIFMACTGLLFLEVCFWMEGETNIVSMAGHTLGKWGRWFAWLLYLFFFYCLTVAYFVGGGNLFATAFPDTIHSWQGMVVFGLLFAPFVFAGAWMVDRVNLFLMFGLVFFYAIFVVLGYSYVNYEHLVPRNWSLSVLALPIAFAAFGYQGLIPTLVHYMNYDVKKLRQTIIIGSFIPLAVYIIWQWLILGIVPAYGPGGLAEALANGHNAVFPLKAYLNDQRVYIVGEFFAFFALATSFFGVTLGMLDFLADGLGVKKTVRGRLFLSGLVYLPPLLFGIFHPHVFLTALNYAGGFGSALLLGLLPVLMVWSGRYWMNLKSWTKLPGGRWTLAALILFVIFELACEFHLIASRC